MKAMAPILKKLTPKHEKFLKYVAKQVIYSKADSVEYSFCEKNLYPTLRTVPAPMLDMFEKYNISALESKHTHPDGDFYVVVRGLLTEVLEKKKYSYNQAYILNKIRDVYLSKWIE